MNTHVRDNLRYLKGIDGRTDFESAVAFITDETSTLTGAQNNVVLAAATVIFRWNGASTATFTGLDSGVDGRIVIIVNVATTNLILNDEDALSTAANRFALTGNLTLRADQGVLLCYDSTSSRWRALSPVTPVTVPDGGTGAATLTGILIGAGTGAFTGVVPAASQSVRRNAGDTAYEAFTPAAAVITREGGNTTEATTTSTTVVDLLSATTLTIAAAEPALIVVDTRRINVGGFVASYGLKLNTTDVITTRGSSAYGFSARGGSDLQGLIACVIGARVTSYLRSAARMASHQGDVTNDGEALNVATANMPTAEVTDVVIEGVTNNAGDTTAADELHVYSLAAS